MRDETPVDPRRVAAVVYDVGVAVDHLLFVFAQELGANGVKVAGFVLLPRSEPGCGPVAPVQLQDVSTGETLALCHVEPENNLCRLDPMLVAEVRRRLREAIESEAELIFIPPFGRKDARGEGFRDEVVHAVRASRRVVMAVPRGLTDNWLSAFTDGVGTLLEARLWVLKDWWNSFEGPNFRAFAQLSQSDTSQAVV